MYPLFYYYTWTLFLKIFSVFSLENNCKKEGVFSVLRMFSTAKCFHSALTKCLLRCLGQQSARTPFGWQSRAARFGKKNSSQGSSSVSSIWVIAQPVSLFKTKCNAAVT